MTREEMNRGVTRKRKKYYDYTLLFLVVFLVCFGLVMIASISAYNAAKYYDDASLFVRKQALFAVVGFVLMIGVSGIDYHVYAVRIGGKKGISLVSVALLCATILQVVVLFVGGATNGATRWIELGPFKLQPSEITKIAVVLWVAYMVQCAPRRLNTFLGFIISICPCLPAIGLVAYENMSTAIVLALIVCGVCFIAARNKKYYIIVALIGAATVAAGMFLVGFRVNRIDSWLHIETADGGYQILQGLYAIASGGWFGKGLGNSIQKLGYIPEVHTDMIFSCICEELGIFGAVCLIALFVLLLWRIFQVAVNASDLFGGLIACGVLIQVAVQVCMNIAVVTNTMPSTGIPLPFISYGGSSLIFMMAEIGLVLSVANRIEYDKK